MAETNPALADQITGALQRHRRSLAAGTGACAAILITALAIPVGLPDTTTGDARGRLGGEPVALAPMEDLSAFVGSNRWGGLTFEELEAQRRAAETGSDSDAARRDRTGFVGTTATSGERVVLLSLPGGEVARIPAGGALPDGRTVSDATDTTATLSDGASAAEELELFPRPASPAEGSTGRQGPVERPAER